MTKKKSTTSKDTPKKGAIDRIEALAKIASATNPQDLAAVAAKIKEAGGLKLEYAIASRMEAFVRERLNAR